MEMTRWQCWWLGEFQSPNDELHELAVEYHDRCDTFDLRLCPPDGIPRTTFERRQVSDHAIRLRRELTEVCQSRGFTPQQLQDAIFRESRNRD